MSLEYGGVTLMQDYLENNEKDTPEILSAGEVRVLFRYDPSNEFAHYNAGVIKSKKSPGEILIFLREVPLKNVRAGIPDKGLLKIFRSTPENVEEIAQLDLSHPEISNWEDVRAYISQDTIIDDQGGEVEEVLLGMTAIRGSDNVPVAATVRGKVIDGNFLIDWETLAVNIDDHGKNVTPISPTEALFRREGFRHSLEVVEQYRDSNGQDKLRVKKVIEFPIKSWCDWQIGTQAQFLPGGILPIHGVKRFSLGIDPQTNVEVFGYTYSLGFAQLDDNLEVIKVTDTPLFNRESFKNILPMGQELDTNKDVVYCCGYSVEGDKVKFIINIGDLMTVEVSKSLSELQRALEKSSPVTFGEVPDRLAA